MRKVLSSKFHVWSRVLRKFPRKFRKLQLRVRLLNHIAWEQHDVQNGLVNTNPDPDLWACVEAASSINIKIELGPFFFANFHRQNYEVLEYTYIICIYIYMYTV